jgi:hypothetical protein
MGLKRKDHCSSCRPSPVKKYLSARLVVDPKSENSLLRMMQVALLTVASRNYITEMPKCVKSSCAWLLESRMPMLPFWLASNLSDAKRDQF